MLKRSFLFISTFIFILFFFSSLAFAAGGYETVYLPENETVDNLYFKTGGSITIDGTVNGEAYLIGENIIVNGNVNGDLIAAGGTITVSGNISENARLAGGIVSVSGRIGKNALVIAGQTEIEKSATIQGNLVEFSGNTNVLGKIDGEVQTMAGNIFFNAKAARNVKITAENLNFGNGTTIAGDFEYQTQNEIKNLKNMVKGNINFVKKNGKLPLFPYKQIALKIFSFASWISYLGSLIIGFLLVFIFPKRFTNINKFIAEKPLASFIFGLAFFALTPPGLIILAATIIGIPLAFLFILLLIFLIFVSRTVVGLAIGSRILNDEESKFLPLLLGMTILQIISLIPYLGFVSKILVIILGTGAILLSKLGKYTK